MWKSISCFIISISTLGFVLNCSHYKLTSGGVLDINSLPAWPLVISANVRGLAHSLEKKDLATFAAFFQSDTLVENQVNHYRDLLLKQHKDVKIQLSNLEILFYYSQRRFLRVAIDDSFFLDIDGPQTTIRIRNASGELFPIDDTNKVLAKAELDYHLKLYTLTKSAKPQEEFGKQILYFRKKSDGNWLISDFLVESVNEKQVF